MTSAAKAAVVTGGFLGIGVGLAAGALTPAWCRGTDAGLVLRY
jgi:hypothetical protein